MALDPTGVDLTTEVVRTDRLVLRPPRVEDEDDILRACQDSEILHWTAGLPDPYTRADAETWVRLIAPSERSERRGLPCVVEAGGRLVGSAALHLHAGGPEVGYWTAPWARRCGYAAEAATALADWAVAHGADQVRLLTFPGNVASQAVARRAGFRPVGVRRGGITKLDGAREDALVFVRASGG